MIIKKEIFLKNPKSCCGCHFLKTRWLEFKAFCFYYHNEYGEPRHIGSTAEDGKLESIIRPDYCIKENGI